MNKPLQYAGQMAPYRARIDALDDRLVDLLAERADIIREVADFKFDRNIPAVLPDRVAHVRDRAAERAADKGLDPDLVRQLYTILIDFSCDLETQIMQDKAQSEERSKVAKG